MFDPALQARRDRARSSVRKAGLRLRDEELTQRPSLVGNVKFGASCDGGGRGRSAREAVPPRAQRL